MGPEIPLQRNSVLLPRVGECLFTLAGPGGEEIYLASDLGGTANKQEDHRPLDKGHSDNPQSAGFIEACVVWVGSKSVGINCKIHKKASLAIRYCAYTWW